MSNRYLYALVRCVPDPRTGEFINVGAIAGDAETGDWAIRQVSSEKRAFKLAGSAALESVHGFLARAQEAIEMQELLFDQDADSNVEYLTEDWLHALYRNHRNVVQLAPPTPMLATSAEEALDLVFERMIVDPVSQPRNSGTTKHAVLAGVRAAYQLAQLPPSLIRQRADVFVGANLHSAVDFAIANGAAVQLTQAWSFQVNGINDITTQVKSWAYALSRIRDGETARVISDSQVSNIFPDVDLQVVVALPKTTEQTEAFGEATQVFAELGATVNETQSAQNVANRAAELISAAH